MPVKKKAKKTVVKRTKKAAPKRAKKAAPKKKPAAKIKKGQAYECGICGYRIIVDEVCGCAEEHLFICCEKTMKKKKAKKKA